MLILGIETSCDETAVSVVEDGRTLLSNIVSSQVDIHARYGGVVPEVASRQHMIQMIPVVSQALSTAGIGMNSIDAIAVTNGPGLAGALLVGVNTAKALAYGHRIPIYGINHLEGHIYAAWLEEALPERNPGFPLLCLIASGGHTDLIYMEDHGKYKLLGRTRDDAAGEAFDKAARTLGLDYPGGPAIQKASEGVQSTETLPRAWMRGTLEFSFSGLKTALLHKVQSYTAVADNQDQSFVANLASAFQTSVVDVLVSKTLDAAKQTKSKGILLGGGVTANALLRETIRAESKELPVLIPHPSLSVDNAAMIAACGFFHAQSREGDALNLDIFPSRSLG